MSEFTKPKAVIWYLAARPCLKQALELLYKNFNNKYQYPVLIFTFGKQYSDRFIRNIHKTIDPNIKFVQIDIPKIPAHIKEKELFYNRKEIPYVRKSFPKSRIGFLHMNQFITGLAMEYPEISKYDYAVRLDDDHFFVKEIDFDLFKFMKDNDYKFGVFAHKDFGYERARQTEIGLRELTKKYIKENNIIPKSGSLDKEGNWDNIGSRNPNIWDMSIFRNENWKKWWSYINKSGGIYKYRWGDLEIHTLFVRMYYPDSAWYNFDFYKKGICKHGGYGPVFRGTRIDRIRFSVKKFIRKHFLV